MCVCDCVDGGVKVMGEGGKIDDGRRRRVARVGGFGFAGDDGEEEEEEEVDE